MEKNLSHEIKTIIFDLGGVYFTDGAKRAISEISSKYNLQEEDVKKVLKGELGTQYRIGKITVDQFWNEAKKIWNKPEIESDDLSQIWLEGYTPIEGTVILVRQLEKSGYKLFFLSDNVKERVEYLEDKYDFLKYFRGGVFSHIVKTRKPDPVIYKKAIEVAGDIPEQCVYIDDKEDLLVPAREIGMKTVHFKSPDQVRVDLEALGVLISEKI